MTMKALCLLLAWFAFSGVLCPRLPLVRVTLLIKDIAWLTLRSIEPLNYNNLKIFY